MPLPSEVFLFGLLIAIAVMVARQTNLFAAAMLTGMFSLTSACLFTLMDAVDVAFTEAAVGAGFSTVLFLSTLALTSRRENQQPPKLFPFIVVMLTGTALAMGVMHMKPYANQDAPIHTHVAAKIKQTEWQAVKRSTQHHGKDGATKDKPHEQAVGLPNLVTSILASYRGYDTLGETGVIFTAGVGVMLLLLGRRREDEDEPEEDNDGEDPENESDGAAAEAAAETGESATSSAEADPATVEIDEDDIELFEVPPIISQPPPPIPADDDQAADESTDTGTHEAATVSNEEDDLDEAAETGDAPKDPEGTP